MIRELTAVAAKVKAAMATDFFTGGVALAAVVSPAWLPMLTQVSSIAALVMPILGAAWLIVQIAAKLHEIIRRSRRR